MEFDKDGQRVPGTALHGSPILMQIIDEEDILLNVHLE
jgi:hypothetical protein